MKKNIYVLVLILGMIIISLKSYSQDPNFHIYLCFGQSNMEGTGTIEAQDRTTNARVKVFQDQTCSNLNRTYGNWYTAAPPLNRCWGGLGIADYFGKTMADATPANITIGLIPASVGGCDIAFFQKGAPLGKASVNGGAAADIPPQFTGGYEWIIDMVTKAKRVGIIKGIIFHQGETNTGDPNWKYKVQGIVNNLRTDLGLGNVPFLAGELLYAQYGACCSSHNVEVNKIPGVITNSYVISASGLPGKDVAHFTSASYRTYGWRYAQQMLALENNGCITTPIESYMQTDGVNWVEQSTAQVCAGATIKLGPHPTNNSGWSWTGPGNFTAVTREISLTNLTIAQGGVYTASYTNEGGCVSKVQITVTVNPLPVLSNHIQVNGGTWDPLDAVGVCTGNNIGSGPWPVSTTGWTWTGPNGFVSAARELQFTHVEPGQGGIYTSTYIDANGCKASLDFLLTVNEMPSAPAVSTPVLHCQNATAVPLRATGAGLKWYTSVTGGTALASAPIPSTATVGTNYYYVSQTTNGCESNRSLIAVTVHTLPAVPTSSSVTYCQNATALPLTATGTSLKWYTTAAAGTALSAAPIPLTTTVGTTDYYVSQTTNGCESNRSLIAVTINPLPSAPKVSTPVAYCQNAAATQLTATGTGLKWFTAAAAGTALSAAPIPSTATVGTTNYYVSQTTNGCESNRTLIAVTVKPVPNAPTVSTPVTYCQKAAATQLTANGAGLKWYSAITGGTGAVTAPVPITTDIGTTNYYVSQTTSGCESSRGMVAVKVHPLPTAVITASGSTNIPQGGSVVLTANAGTAFTYKWFNGNVQVGGIGTTFTATEAGVYTVEVTNGNNCSTTSAGMHVNLNSNQPSVITITSPLANSTVQGVITITAVLTDPDGSITLVEYLDGNTVIGTGTSAPYSFEWNNADEGNHVISVRVTDSNRGVTISAPVTITSEAITTGVQTSNTLNAVVYPNPSNSEVYVDTDVNLSDAHFTIVDALGKEVVFSSTGTGRGAKIDVSSLRAGTYVLIIKNDDSIMRRKITVIK